MQNIQFSLSLADYSENTHDWENKKIKNDAKVQNMQLRFVRQTILRVHMIVQIKKDIEKKKGKNREGQYSSKQLIQIAFTTMSSKLSPYEHSQT